jgi:RNA polymerase sigma-70 factor, ECF subfamily
MHELREVAASREQRTWRAYRARLYHFVLGRVGDEASAEDIVHDVLSKAYERRDTLRDPGKLGQWMYQIARNAIVDHYRTRRPMEELPEALSDEGVGAGDDARRELASCLRPFVKELPPRYRRAVELSEFDGLTQRQVASKLGLSVSGAKSRVQRARRMLGKMLAECCRLEFDGRGSLTGYEPKKGCGGC